MCTHCSCSDMPCIHRTIPWSSLVQAKLAWAASLVFYTTGACFWVDANHGEQIVEILCIWHKQYLPSLADWAVFKCYAHCIQQVEVQNDHICFLLEYAVFESNLLPNLKALKWKKVVDIDPAGIMYTQPLLGPGLVILDVSGMEYDIALALFPKSCPSHCPSVMTARFSIYMQAQPGLIDILLRTLCSFKNLKCLTINTCVNEDVLQYLLMSPQFQELNIWIWPNQLWELSPPPSNIPLCNIKNLTLRLDDLCLVTELLHPGHQSFCDITLYLDGLECATLICSFFTGHASHPQKSPLWSFQLFSFHQELWVIHSYIWYVHSDPSPSTPFYRM